MIVKLQQLGTESTELTLCILTFIIIVRRKKQVEYNCHEHVFAKISYESRGLTEDSRLSLSTRNSFMCQLQKLFNLLFQPNRFLHLKLKLYIASSCERRPNNSAPVIKTRIFIFSLHSALSVIA